MNKNLLLGLSILSIGIFLASFAGSPTTVEPYEVSEDYLDAEVDQQDWNSCVEKLSSEWGGKCMNYGFSEKKYTVHLINTCSDQVDLMSCVQRDNDRWRCFYRLDMRQNDTLHAFACRGNGKYLKWVRKAGDITTKFPSIKEVNDQY